MNIPKNNVLNMLKDNAGTAYIFLEKYFIICMRISILCSSTWVTEKLPHDIDPLFEIDSTNPKTVSHDTLQKGHGDFVPETGGIPAQNRFYLLYIQVIYKYILSYNFSRA